MQGHGPGEKGNDRDVPYNGSISLPREFPGSSTERGNSESSQFRDGGGNSKKSGQRELTGQGTRKERATWEEGPGDVQEAPCVRQLCSGRCMIVKKLPEAKERLTSKKQADLFSDVTKVK